MSLMIASVIVWLVITPIIGAIISYLEGEKLSSDHDVLLMYAVGLVAEIASIFIGTITIIIYWAFNEVVQAIINGGF